MLESVIGKTRFLTNLVLKSTMSTPLAFTSEISTATGAVDGRVVGETAVGAERHFEDRIRKIEVMGKKLRTLDSEVREVQGVDINGGANKYCDRCLYCSDGS